MNLQRAVQFAKAYHELGWAVQEQFHNVVDDGMYDELNPNALRMISDLLEDFSGEIDGAEEALVQIEDAMSYLGSARDFVGQRRSSFVPMARTAALSPVERAAIVSEDGVASNLDKLQVEGTQYEEGSETDPDDWRLFLM